MYLRRSTSSVYLAACALVALALPACLSSQQLASAVAAARSDGSARTTRVIATRTVRPPVIDGRDGDEAWRDVPEVGAFRVYDPVEDGTPAMRTAARVTFDAHNLYAIVRAYDPHPDSIVSLLSRRDVRTQSDQIKLVIDSYFDHRTGYEFAVNPAGVQRDYYVFDDGNEDDSWDGVWEVKTSIDSLGWIAEFRIPLSQLRYPKRDVQSFGIGVFRDVARSNERSSWPLFRRSRSGLSSQLGELSGITGLGSPRRLELRPYTVQKNVSVPSGATFGRDMQTTIGADIKYGLTSNLTVDATVNPDFGQVEADPAVLNLSAFEQFYAERRPFFLEGTGIFRFDMNCSDDVCTGLFYSRRIGRAPQLGDVIDSLGLTSVPAASNIIGAAKLTGRLGNGLSIGVLDAVTQRQQSGGVTVEPQTHYVVARLEQDLRGGETSIGAMATGMDRDLDPVSEPYLRRAAYTGGIDFRHRFANRTYQLSGYVVGSHVSGSPLAIARTQRSSVHNFQRPDDDLAYDSTRTSLDGAGMQLGLGKQAGLLRFWTGYSRYSPGLEINDVGFLSRVDQQSYSNWFALLFNTPRAFYRRLQVNFNEWQSFSTSGMRTSLGGNVNANSSLKNLWFAYAGVGIDGPRLCELCTRGGPALRTSPSVQSWSGLTGDPRGAIVPGFSLNFSRGDGGRSRSVGFGPSVTMRSSSRFSVSLSPYYSHNVDDEQWNGNFGVVGSDTTHYTVAHLDQQTLSLTTRVDFTATPSLSLQFYAQPFVSAGEYSDWRELSAPRAADRASRFKPFTLEGDPGGFNYKQFRSNTVLRWEYRPGSTLFLVWQQGRSQDGLDIGTFRVGRDYRNLFSARPDNTFLLKASYWFSL